MNAQVFRQIRTICLALGLILLGLVMANQLTVISQAGPVSVQISEQMLVWFAYGFGVAFGLFLATAVAEAIRFHDTGPILGSVGLLCGLAAVRLGFEKLLSTDSITTLHVLLAVGVVAVTAGIFIPHLIAVKRPRQGTDSSLDGAEKKTRQMPQA